MGSSILPQKETQSIIFLAYYLESSFIYGTILDPRENWSKSHFQNLFSSSRAICSSPSFRAIKYSISGRGSVGGPYRSCSIHCLWEHSYLQLSCSSRSDSSRMSTGANDLCSVLRAAINEYTTRPSILKGYSEKSLLQSWTSPSLPSRGRVKARIRKLLLYQWIMMRIILYRSDLEEWLMKRRNNYFLKIDTLSSHRMNYKWNKLSSRNRSIAKLISAVCFRHSFGDLFFLISKNLIFTYLE